MKKLLLTVDDAKRNNYMDKLLSVLYKHRNDSISTHIVRTKKPFNAKDQTKRLPHQDL